jgi:hypothetical protein
MGGMYENRNFTNTPLVSNTMLILVSDKGMKICKYHQMKNVHKLGWRIWHTTLSSW